MANANRQKTRTDARQLSIIIKMLRAQDQKTRDVAARALKEVDPGSIESILADPELSRTRQPLFDCGYACRRKPNAPGEMPIIRVRGVPSGALRDSLSAPRYHALDPRKDPDKSEDR